MAHVLARREFQRKRERLDFFDKRSKIDAHRLEHVHEFALAAIHREHDRNAMVAMHREFERLARGHTVEQDEAVLFHGFRHGIRIQPFRAAVMAMEHNQVLALILKIEGKFLEMEIAIENL